MQRRGQPVDSRMDVAELWTQIEAAGPLDEYEAAAAIVTELGVDDNSERAAMQYERRRTFIARYAWAVPNKEAIAGIEAFVAGRKTLEVGAGAGLWARLLSALGVDILATDGAPPAIGRHFGVEEVEAEAAVRAHDECTVLLLCWPPFRNDCAYRALRAFKGDRVVSVGDARFIGDGQYHDLFAREWQLAERVLIPAWPALHDYAYFFRRAD